MATSTIHISLIDNGLSQFIQRLTETIESTPQIEYTGVELGETSPLFKIEYDRFSAGGTDDIFIHLKPSERLMKLMATLGCGAGEIERLIENTGHGGNVKTTTS